MTILIDECLPTILQSWLDQHEAKTAQQMGWAGLTNGELLKAAQEVFDVFLTSDKRIWYQQNLPLYDIKLLILPSNRLKIVRRCLPMVLQALAGLEAGSEELYVEIAMPD